MNKEVPKCKGCSRRRKSSDDIPSEVIYLYCKPCCKPGTIHKTKCCDKCSIFDSMPMCRRPSSDINLRSVGNPLNIELLPGYDEPSNKIDRMLRELFDCEDDAKSDEEIFNNLKEDAKCASAEAMPAYCQPVVHNNEDRTSWMRKLLKAEMSKEAEQPTEVPKSKNLDENINCPKSERSKNSIENNTFNMYTKSERWNKSEIFSMSSADSTKMRAFIDLQIPENYEEFKPLKIPAEWKKPIETNESVIWKTNLDRSISREASNLVNARQGKARETKSTPKPAEFRKCSDSEGTKGQIPSRVGKVSEQVKPTERKIPDEIKNSSTKNSSISRKPEDSRKSGDGRKPGDIQKSRKETKILETKPERNFKSRELSNCTPRSSKHTTETKKLMSARSISYSTSSEEVIQTPRISERKKFKERKIFGSPVVSEITPNEDNPKSGEFRNFPYSTIFQNKSDNVKDRVEELRNFGDLENLSSSKNLKDARTIQEMEKFENLKILTNEWYKPQELNVPTGNKKSREELDKEQKKFEEMQKIIELISFLSKTSENESEYEEPFKGGQDDLRELKQPDQLKKNSEFKKTDDTISSKKATQPVFPESSENSFIDLINSSETIKSAEFGEQSKNWGALAKVKNSNEKLPREVEDIKKNELPSKNSAHKFDEESTTTEEIQSKIAGGTQDKTEQTAEVETQYENLPESENFWNFVRLRALEEDEYSRDLTDTEEIIEERKFDGYSLNVEAMKTSTYDSQLEERIKHADLTDNLTDILYSASSINTEPARTWSDVSQLAELRSSESSEKFEHINNGEMEPARTWSDVSQPAELRSSESSEKFEQLNNSEMGPARTWSDVSQLAELRKSESFLEMLEPINNNESEPATTWSDVSQLVELRSSESSEKFEQLNNSEMGPARIWSDVSQLAELRKSESFLEMLEPINNNESEPARTWSDVSQPAELRSSGSSEKFEQIKSSDMKSARIWSDVSHLAGLRKSESFLEMLEPINNNESEPATTWSDVSQLVELRSSESSEKFEQLNNSEMGPARAWSDVSQLAELRKSESFLEMLEPINNNESEPARTWSDVSQPAELRSSESSEKFEQIKSSEMKSARVWSDVSQLAELRKPESLEKLEPIINNESEQATTWSDVSQLVELRSSETAEKFEQLNNSEMGPARTWSDVSQLAELRKSESFLEMLEPINNNESEPARTWSDVSQPAELRSSESSEKFEQIKSSEMKSARVWSDVSQLAELRKPESLEKLEPIINNESEQATTWSDVSQLVELRSSETSEKFEQLNNSEMGLARTWSDVSQLAELRKSESFLEMLEPINNNESEPARTWSDVSQPAELRSSESSEKFEQIKSSEMKSARIWSDVSQLTQLRESERLEMLPQINNNEMESERIWSDVSQLAEVRKSEGLEMLEQINNNEREPERTWSDASPLAELRSTESLEMHEQINNNSNKLARIWSDVSQLAELRLSENLEKFEQIKSSNVELARIWSDVSQIAELRTPESLEKLEQIKNSEIGPPRIWSDVSQVAEQREEQNYQDRIKQKEIQVSEGLEKEAKVEMVDVPVYRELSNLNRFAITEQARTAQELGIPIVCEEPSWKKVVKNKGNNPNSIRKCICSNSSQHPRNLAELRKFEYRTNPNWKKTRKLKMSDVAKKNLKEPFKCIKRQREIPISELATTSTEVTQSCGCEEVEKWERYQYDKGRFFICPKEPRKATKVMNPVDVGKTVKYRKYGTCRVSSKTWKEIKRTEKIKIAKNVWNVIHLTRSEDNSGQEDRKRILKLQKLPNYIPVTCSTDTRISSFDSIKLQDWAKPKRRETAGGRTREIGKNEQLRKPEGFEKLEVRGTAIGLSMPEQLRNLDHLETPERFKEAELPASAELQRPDLLQPANRIMPEAKRLWTDVSQHEELMEPEDYYKHALRESGIHTSLDILSSDPHESDVSSNLKAKLSWTDISQVEEIMGTDDLKTLEHLKEKEKFVPEEMQASVNSSMAEAKKTQPKEVKEPEENKKNTEIRESKDIGTPPFWVSSASSSYIGQFVEPRAPSPDFNNSKMNKSHEEIGSEMNQSTGQKVGDLWKVSSRSEIYRYTDDQSRDRYTDDQSKDMKNTNDELERGRYEQIQTQATHSGDISHTADSDIVKTSLEMSQLEEFRMAKNLKISQSMRNAGRSTPSGMQTDLSKLLWNSEVKTISTDKRRRSVNELNKSLKGISQSKSLSEQIFSGDTEKSTIWGNPKAWRKIRDTELYGKVQNSKDASTEEIEILSKPPTNIGEKEEFVDWSKQLEIHGPEESEYKGETEDVPVLRELANSNRFNFTEQAKTAQELDMPVVCGNKGICSANSYQSRSSIGLKSRPSELTVSTEVAQSCEPEEVETWVKYRKGKGRSFICLNEPRKSTKLKDTVVMGKSVKYGKYGNWRVSSKTQKEIETVEKIKIAKKLWNVIYLAGSDDKSDEEDRKSMPKCMLPSCSTDTRISSIDSIKHQDWRNPNAWGASLNNTTEINKKEHLRKSERLETPKPFKETEMLASAQVQAPDLLQPVYLIMAEAKRIWTDVSQHEELMQPEDYDIRALRESAIHRTITSQPEEHREQLSLKAPQGSENNESKKNSEIRDSENMGTPWASASSERRISSDISQSVKPRAPPADFNIEANNNIKEPIKDLKREMPTSELATASTEVTQSCQCKDVKTWLRYRDDADCSFVCLKEPKKSTKLKNSASTGKSVKYRKYGTWRVSSKTYKEIRTTEKIKIAKKIWNVIHLARSGDNSSEECRRSMRKGPKYNTASCSTHARISSFDSVKLQDWGKPKKCETPERKINKRINTSSKRTKNGKLCHCCRSTTSDESTTSIEKCTLERRRANAEEETQGGRYVETNSEYETYHTCTCSISSEEVEYPAGARESAGTEEFPVLGDNSGVTMTELENIDSGSDKEVPKAQNNPKSGELLYYFRAPSSEDARNSIMKQFGGTENPLVGNQFGRQIKCVNLVKCNKSGTLKYWAIPRHFNVPSNLSTFQSFGLGRLEELRKKNDFEDLDDGPIILKGSPHQQKSNESVVVDVRRETVICERNYEEVKNDEKTVEVNAVQCLNNATNAQMCRGMILKNEEICDQQDLIKQNFASGLMTTDSKDSVGFQTLEGQFSVSGLSKQSLTKERKLDTTAQIDNNEEIMLIERMSGGGEMNDDTEEEEEEEVQEEIYDENLCKTKFRKRAATVGSPPGCNMSESSNLVGQSNLAARTMRGVRSNNSNLRSDRGGRSHHSYSRNDTRFYAGAYSQHGRRDVDDEDVGVVQKVQNVTRRITSSGNVVEVCETVRYAKMFKNSYEDVNPRMEFSSFNPYNTEYPPCTMPCNSCSLRTNQSSNYSNSCCCGHSDQCCVTDPCCCDCDQSSYSDSDVGHVILSKPPSIGYLNKHEEDIDTDNWGMNKSKNFNSEENLSMANTAETNHETGKTNQNSSDSSKRSSPCYCDCPRSNSDCDGGCVIPQQAPSIGYLNKHDEDIVADKYGMNKSKNFNSEENLRMENKAEANHETAETSQISSDNSKNPCCCMWYRSKSDSDSGCAVLTEAPPLGYLGKHDDESKSSGKNIGMENTAETYNRSQTSDVSYVSSLDHNQNDAEDSGTKQSKEHENDAVELANDKSKSTSSQAASKFRKGNSIENSGSMTEPGPFNGNNRVLHPNKEFQSAQRKIKRHCTISGPPYFDKKGCRLLRLGPLIGSRRTHRIPDDMGFMMPTKKVPSYSEVHSKEIDPINLRAGAELDAERSHMFLAELNAVLANKRNCEGNNVREIYNRNQTSEDPRRTEPARKFNFISEMKNYPTHHRKIGVSNNNQMFYNGRETYVADSRDDFEPDFEPQTYDHHYPSLADRAARYHQRRLDIDRRSEDLSSFYSNEYDLSNEESNHFQRKPDAVVNILVDSKGRGQVFGPDVKSVNYSPNIHGATSTSIISISTNRRKNLSSIDERIHYNRERQARKSRSYDAFQQLSSARYEETDELQMRNQRLGGGADRTNFEEREFCGNDNRQSCCRNRCNLCLDGDMASAPENRARNLNQRTYDCQKFNEPEMGCCCEGNHETGKGGYFPSEKEESFMDVVGGAKRRNLGGQRSYFENGADLQQYRKSAGSDMSIAGTDGQPLPEEFVLSQSDFRKALQNNEKGFYVDLGPNKNRSRQLRRQSDTLLETRSREKANSTDRKFINDSINNETFIRRRTADSLSPASNNGIQRTYKSERRHSDHRKDAGGGSWEISHYYMDGPTFEQRGNRYISERDDLYMNNDFESSSRRNPTFLNGANDDYYIRPGNRQQEVRYQSGRPMPNSINYRSLDGNIFPDEYQGRRGQHDTRIRRDIEEQYPYRNTGEMFDYGRRNAVERREREYNEDGRTYRNEGNFNERRNNCGCRYHNCRRISGAGERHYSRGNIIENQSNDFHTERPPDYLRLEFGEDDNVEERILFDDNGNVLDIPTQPTYKINNKLHIDANKRMSNMHEPLHCYNKKISHGNDPLFYHRKALVDADTSALSVVEKGRVTRLKAGREKKSKFVYKDESANKPNEEIICYRRRINGGRSGNDADNMERQRNGHDSCYNNAVASSFEDPRYRRSQRDFEDPCTNSSKLESRNQRGVYDRNCYNRQSSEDHHYRKLKRSSEEPITNCSNELMERAAHRSTKTTREEKYERNRCDDVPANYNNDNARSRRPEASSSKRKPNREYALVDPRTIDRHQGGERKSTGFNSANTEESVDKSNTSVAPRYDDRHNKETSTSSSSGEKYISQSKMSDISLVQVEDGSFGSRRMASSEREEVSYVSRTTSYHERRSGSDEPKTYNRSENGKEENRSPRISITTYDTTADTETQHNASWFKPSSRENNRLPEPIALKNSRNCSTEMNRRCSQDCKPHDCTCKCHTAKKCGMCKCRSKNQSSSENVLPIFSNWLQESTETDNKTIEVISCESICRLCRSEKARANHNKGPCSCCRCSKVAKHDELPPRNCKGRCGCADSQPPKENRQHGCCCSRENKSYNRSRENMAYNWDYDRYLQQANYMTQLPVCSCNLHTVSIPQGCGCSNI